MSKENLFNIIDENEEDLKEIASNIWEYAEGPYNETKSSTLQKDYLRSKGFKIIEIPNIETAFIAEFGKGEPILGILGEYDALPGLSQKISTVKEPLISSKYGHGCGHNLLGTGGVGAVLAVKEIMIKEELKGTIRYYGSPAEELLSGKVKMAREKVFDDLDAAISWHPASMNAVSGSSTLAMNSIKFKFKGVSAHAAAAPQAGKSALDAVELMNVGANYLRERVSDNARIHYIITDGGEAPNIVPAFAEVWYYARAPKREEVKEISDRLYNIAKGATMMTDTTFEYELLAGCYDVLPNNILGNLLHSNMIESGGPKFTNQDYEFAQGLYDSTTKEDRRKIMGNAFAPEYILDKILCDKILEINDNGKISAGSTDVGDVSYITPFAQFTAATWPVGTAGHTWIATAASGSGIGLNAMIFASKTIAGTLYDLLKDGSILKRAKEEFKNTLGNYEYISPFDN